MLTVDVDLNSFVSFMKGESFFWTENIASFVFVKPYQEYCLRCIITKSTPEKDEEFRLREISTRKNAFRVLDFTFDGNNFLVKQETIVFPGVIENVGSQ